MIDETILLELRMPLKHISFDDFLVFFARLFVLLVCCCFVCLFFSFCYVSTTLENIESKASTFCAQTEVSSGSASKDF